MVGLIRGVSEGLGPVGGAAAIYSLSGLLLIFTVGFPRIRQIPKGYLLAGSLLFVSYEICLALSLGYAATRHQAIVGATYYFNKNMSTYVDYKINLLDEDDSFYAANGISTDDIVALGLVYQF